MSHATIITIKNVARPIIAAMIPTVSNRSRMSGENKTLLKANISAVSSIIVIIYTR